MVQSNLCQLRSWERLINTPEAVIWLFGLEGQRKCEGNRCCLQGRKWAASGCGRARGREGDSHQAASLPDLSLPPTHSFTPQLLGTTIHQVWSSGWGGTMENKSPGPRVESQTMNINIAVSDCDQCSTMREIKPGKGRVSEGRAVYVKWSGRALWV